MPMELLRYDCLILYTIYSADLDETISILCRIAEMQQNTQSTHTHANARNS